MIGVRQGSLARPASLWSQAPVSPTLLPPPPNCLIEMRISCSKCVFSTLYIARGFLYSSQCWGLTFYSSCATPSCNLTIWISLSCNMLASNLSVQTGTSVYHGCCLSDIHLLLLSLHIPAGAYTHASCWGISLNPSLYFPLSCSL